jgi:hypothetical protein
MAKVTNQDVTLTFRNYGNVTVPKGTIITNKTALGVDDRYNFVDDFTWINKSYPDIASILKHDAMYYGINIPSQFVDTLEQ